MAQIQLFKFDTDGMPIEHDPVLDDITFASLTLDAGGAGIAMNSTKISGLGAGTVSGDALAFGQTGATLGDLTIAAAGNITLSGGGEIVGLPTTPTGPGSSASKAYVDSVVQGLDVHDSVRAATTTVQTLSTDFANGSIIDGVTLATNDRVLIKNQANGVENGIYVVNATGAPTRAADWASGYQAASAFTFVEEGTVNADSGFVCTNDAAADTTGTDALTFSQFSGAGQIFAGAGLTKTGNTIDAVGGNGIVANANDLAVDPDTTTGGNIQPVNVVVNGVGLDVSAIAGTGLEADGSANLRLAAQGNGIAGGGGTTLSVLPDTTSTTTTEANAINVGANGVSVKVDDSSIEGSAQGGGGAEVLRVKAGGITGAMLNAAININTTGNITTTAGIFTGDGSGLTNLPSAASTDAVTVSALKSTAGTLNPGDVVHLVGYSSPNYTVELADASSASLMPAIGIVATTVTDVSAGTVVIQGKVGNINTSAFSAGDTLYVSTTAGGLTNVKPTGATNLIQRIGEVAFVHATTGVIQVTGAGRSNDVPNLALNDLWIGNSSGVASPTTVHDGLTATPGTSIGIDLTPLGGLELVGTSPNKTLSAKVDGTTISIDGLGQLTAVGATDAERVETVYTTDGVGVTAGDPVYVSANNIVSKCDAANNNTRKFIGIAKTTVGPSLPVSVVSAGKLQNVSIAGTPAAGDLVYLAVGGGLTTTIPPHTSGNHRMVIGKVSDASGTPDIHLQPQYIGKVR